MALTNSIVASGLNLDLTTTDTGDPGASGTPVDTVGLRLYSSNTMWFSSNYNAGKTLEQPLGNGNAKVMP